MAPLGTMENTMTNSVLLSCAIEGEIVSFITMRKMKTTMMRWRNGETLNSYTDDEKYETNVRLFTQHIHLKCDLYL